MSNDTVNLEFESPNGTGFAMRISEEAGLNSTLEWTVDMTRKKAEELLFQMAFILGYKVA